MPRRPPRSTVRAELDRVEQRPPGMTTALYRRFDKDGRLLYIGISDWPYDRAVGHGVHSLWVQFVASGTNTWFAGRKEASDVEKLAIKEELPLFNRLHSAPGAKERLLEYLTAQGRMDLIEQTANWVWSYTEIGSRRTLRPL
jgi:hypothetical protein